MTCVKRHDVTKDELDGVATCFEIRGISQHLDEVVKTKEIHFHLQSQQLQVMALYKEVHGMSSVKIIKKSS